MSHKLTQIHKTHHALNLEKIIIVLTIIWYILCNFLKTFFLRFPRCCKFTSPTKLGVHNFLVSLRIGKFSILLASSLIWNVKVEGFNFMFFNLVIEIWIITLLVELVQGLSYETSFLLSLELESKVWKWT
jgi:hypothetical protein